MVVLLLNSNLGNNKMHISIFYMYKPFLNSYVWFRMGKCYPNHFICVYAFPVTPSQSQIIQCLLCLTSKS